jgi:hypothetical protein
MKAENPIEEIWRIRDEIAAEHGYDVDRLFDAMQIEQERYADRVVHHVPRRAPEASAEAESQATPKTGLTKSE